ncbi:hypothetical protein ILP92_14320 [Maribius pontilimi]|uniref:Uncharacterized protein n=1 Tax=Palleronia pontilimi TaxID=1964209 RepID=A0A934MI50_9RHOB|nr:hypothetical protein [Palleronia pontilimi]MBJ3763924.1 hypothetical protein [Palleronia pontilimi]
MVVSILFIGIFPSDGRDILARFISNTQTERALFRTMMQPAGSRRRAVAERRKMSYEKDLGNFSGTDRSRDSGRPARRYPEGR